MQFFFRLFQKILGLSAMTIHIIVILDAGLLYLMNGFLDRRVNGVKIVPITNRLGKGDANGNASSH